MKKKTLIKTLVSSLFCVGVLVACSGNSNSSLPTNEVLTTIPYDTSKETLVISVSDGIDAEKLKKDLDAKFTDINIVLRFGMDITSSVLGNTSDIYLPLSPTISPNVEENLLDLSSFESTGKYYATALKGCSSFNNSKQYLLPMASNIRGIVYNKTMFDENGWQVPKSRTEFVNLCHTIDASGLVKRAFQPSFYYNGEVLNFAQFSSMSSMFDTLDFFSWVEKYSKQGIGSAEYILSSLLKPFKYYLDEKVIELSDVTIKPATRSSMLYKTRETAMTIETQNASLYALQYESTDEFAMFPYFSGDGANDDYVLSSPISYLAVNANVAKKGNEKKLKLVTQFLDYIATKEGQKALIPEGNAAITQLKDAEIESGDSVMLKNVEKAMKAGRMVQPRSFYNSDITLCRSAFFDVFNSYFNTERKNTNIIDEDRAITFEEAVAYLDSINKIAINNSISYVTKVYGTSLKAFTVLETTEFLADMIKEKTNADFSLYLSNTLSRGNNIAIYQGDLVEKSGGIYPYDFLTSMDAISRGQGSGDDKKVVTLNMTGQQVLNAIENPDETGDIPMFEPFFVSSGLKITFAPWAKKGSRYLKVTLANGTPLELDKVYTVAAWNNTIRQEFINEYVEIYDDTFVSLLEAKLTRDQEISPVTDGRFKLDWSVVNK